MDGCCFDVARRIRFKPNFGGYNGRGSKFVQNPAEILFRLSQTVSKSRVEIVDSAIQRVAHRLNLFIVTRLDHEDSVVPAAKADF